ncbi:hypothetical protein JCM6882_005674 [Rhodosporidiobolus microsporus]
MSAPLYSPFIVVPPLTCCEHAYLVYGQGTPPYDINIISTGDANGTSLEAISQRDRAGVVRWRVDFNEGANITFSLTDANGQQAYSQYRVVQAGEATTCSKTTYSSSRGPNIGGIVGGLLGALVLLSLFGLLVWWRRRRLRQRRRELGLSGGSKNPSDDDMRLANGPAEVVRAGTFNLGNVRFTEASLDVLRTIDRPPNYDEARATREANAAGGGEGDLSSATLATAAAATGAETAPSSSASTQRVAPPVPRRRDRIREAQERRDRELAERLARQEEEEGESGSVEFGSAAASRVSGESRRRRSESIEEA